LKESPTRILISILVKNLIGSLLRNPTKSLVKNPKRILIKIQTNLIRYLASLIIYPIIHKILKELKE
jgi:hypothetical protein